MRHRSPCHDFIQVGHPDMLAYFGGVDLSDRRTLLQAHLIRADVDVSTSFPTALESLPGREWQMVDN